MFVVAVVLLVAMAGCSGLSDDGTPTANATANATTNATTNVTTPTDTTSNISSADTTPTGAGLDGAELNAATRGAAESSGSYTIQTVDIRSSPQGQQAIQSTTRINLSADRGRRATNYRTRTRRGTTQVPADVYTATDTSYRELNSSQNTSYDVDSDGYDGQGDISPVNVSAFSRNLTYLSDGLVWAENGTTTVDGVNATRYDLVADTTADTGTTNGTLLVDSDDVVRQVTLTTTVTENGQTSRGLLQFTFSDFGSTTVATPDWLPQARQSNSTATSNSTSSPA